MTGDARPRFFELFLNHLHYALLSPNQVLTHAAKLFSGTSGGRARRARRALVVGKSNALLEGQVRRARSDDGWLSTYKATRVVVDWTPQALLLRSKKLKQKPRSPAIELQLVSRVARQARQRLPGVPRLCC